MFLRFTEQEFHHKQYKLFDNRKKTGDQNFYHHINTYYIKITFH